MNNYVKEIVQFFPKFNRHLLFKYKKIVKLKTIFICVLIIIFYVSLNNYFIMFVYFNKPNQRSSPAQFVDDTRHHETEIQITDQPNADQPNLQIFVDSQDLVLDSLRNVTRIMNESYFDEEIDTGPRPCIHPNLNPFDKEILKFVVPERVLNCNPKQNWVTVENGTIVFSSDATSTHGPIICAYIPLYRGDDDFKVLEGNRIFPIIDRMPLITDFFKVDCRSKDGAIYSNIHSGIAYDSSLMMRPVWNPMSKNALGYNVLMLGFDSVSRMSFIRMMPKTYEYIIKELGIVVLKGYNIVGDGTPQALLPILTGKKETELPEARRGFVNVSYVDKFPWIWKDYKNSGYVTQVRHINIFFEF